jgi:hypothetical protein
MTESVGLGPEADEIPEKMSIHEKRAAIAAQKRF